MALSHSKFHLLYTLDLAPDQNSHLSWVISLYLSSKYTSNTSDSLYSAASKKKKKKYSTFQIFWITVFPELHPPFEGSIRSTSQSFSSVAFSIDLLNSKPVKFLCSTNPPFNICTTTNLPVFY